NCIFRSLAKTAEQEDPGWFEGMLVELRISMKGRCEAVFHSFEQSRGFVGLRALTGQSREDFLRSLEERSHVLADPLALRDRWTQFCRTHKAAVLARSHGVSGFLAGLNHRIPFSRLADAFADKNLRLNLVACESHRELLADCLRLER